MLIETGYLFFPIPMNWLDMFELCYQLLWRNIVNFCAWSCFPNLISSRDEYKNPKKGLKFDQESSYRAKFALHVVFVMFFLPFQINPKL